MLHHYVNTARNNVKTFLRGERVRPKKYFYAIRPILACRWVMAENCPPPVPFQSLADAMLPGALRPSVERLLDLKINGPEKLEIPPLADVGRWLDESIAEIDAAAPAAAVCGEDDWTPLNRFFLDELARG